MRSYSRELTVLGVLGALCLQNCTQLTKIDWSQIPPAGGGTSGGEAGMAGESAGAAGELLAGEGGMGGEAGLGGEGGVAGEAGNTGEGGTGGSIAGNAGSGGTLAGNGGGGTGGSIIPGGGTGGGEEVHPTCTTAPTAPSSPPNLTNALVLFDGGAGGNGNRGGRIGLDNACKAAKDQLALPQTTAAAVISVSKTDQIYDMPERFHFPRRDLHVLSPLGIEFAPSWESIWGRGGTPTSLVCAGVMPPTVETWLTGTGNATLASPLDSFLLLMGIYEYVTDLSGVDYSHACNEWGYAENDPDIYARVGSTIAVKDGGVDGWPYFVRFKQASCGVANDHVLCLAFNPVP